MSHIQPPQNWCSSFLSSWFVMGFGLAMTSLVMTTGRVASAQDEAVEPKIDFTQTIKPIIDARCATCHNEEEEEGGLNLNDLDIYEDYVEPGKPLESALFQCLTGSNDWSQMPPEEDNAGDPLEPCTQSEMALIFLWIQQGASFEGVPEPEEKEEAVKSAAHRLFLFSGYFHPAIVHFPIALITISAFFIIFCFKNESLSDDAAYYLLFFGTLSSVVACIFGWAFAERNPVAISDFALGINRHRWFGIGATVLAIITTIIGWRARADVMKDKNGMWKFGVILTAALMGVVGHQGGEEVYGEGVYDRAAEKLIPEFWPFSSEKENSDKPDDENAEANSANQGSGESDNDNAGSSDEKQNDDDSSSGYGDNSSNDSGNGEEDDNGSPPSDPTLNKSGP